MDNLGYTGSRYQVFLPWKAGQGPKWLHGGENEWPRSLVFNNLVEIGEERKKVNVLHVSKETYSVGKAISIEKFSSLGKLSRVEGDAYVNYFLFIT